MSYEVEQIPSKTSSGVVEVIVQGKKGEPGKDVTVIDNLTSTDIDQALSANQGKVLKDAQDLLDSRLTTEENKEVIDTTARANAANAQADADSNNTLILSNSNDIYQNTNDISLLDIRLTTEENKEVIDTTARGKADNNESDISALDTRLTVEENKEVVDITARADATQAISDAVAAQLTADNNATNLANLIQDLLDIQSTYGALANTVSDNTGIPNPNNTLVFNMVGSGDELLTPPISPQPILNPQLNGYIPIPLSILSTSGFLTDTGDGGLLVLTGGSGFYTTPQAWITMSSSAGNNNVGFIFGIHRGNEIYFSQRITQSEMAGGDDTTNVSGGGFIELLEGDKIYVYGGAERNADITIYDANLGLTMRYKQN